jgi:hypothetical protein
MKQKQATAQEGSVTVHKETKVDEEEEEEVPKRRKKQMKTTTTMTLTKEKGKEVDEQEEEEKATSLKLQDMRLSNHPNHKPMGDIEAVVTWLLKTVLGLTNSTLALGISHQPEAVDVAYAAKSLEHHGGHARQEPVPPPQRQPQHHRSHNSDDDDNNNNNNNYNNKEDDAAAALNRNYQRELKKHKQMLKLLVMCKSQLKT